MIQITREAIERRARRYGEAFPKAMLAAATEISPDVFHVSLRDYARIIREHRDPRDSLRGASSARIVKVKKPKKR